MFYRILDDYWDPYCFGYNERNLKNVAYWMYNMEEDFWEENWYNEKELYRTLKGWIRHIWGYHIEQQRKPFEEYSYPF